jgi:hypothetical protein
VTIGARISLGTEHSVPRRSYSCTMNTAGLLFGPWILARRGIRVIAKRDRVCIRRPSRLAHAPTAASDRRQGRTLGNLLELRIPWGGHTKTGLFPGSHDTVRSGISQHFGSLKNTAAPHQFPFLQCSGHRVSAKLCRSPWRTFDLRDQARWWRAIRPTQKASPRWIALQIAQQRDRAIGRFDPRIHHP